ncbi:MAG: class I SAM-dependent methyltransferase [Rhizobiales bacterium]|nr:class I SAM-dependent methyltransferase [Hyphomicrobiales bacterium]
MDTLSSGQVTASAADVYEEFFVPALFRPWANHVADAAAIASGQGVLDVACGTGVLTREIHTRVQPGGTATGLDCNPDMLATAKRTEPAVDWQSGRAEALPFADHSFDAVVSQFGIMFFEDRQTALTEMWRVLRPGGKLAIAVWDKLDNTPGYAAMIALLDRLFGPQVAAALQAPFVLGEPDELRALLAAAGISQASIETRNETAKFPSISEWVHTDVKGWTLADMVDDEQYALLQREAQIDLAPFAIAKGGPVEFTAPGHIISATKP